MTERTDIVERLLERAGLPGRFGYSPELRMLVDAAAEIERLRAAGQPAGDLVTVPRAALEWLFGSAPDHEGMWFGESSEQTAKKYGFRSRLRKMCEALGHPLPQLYAASLPTPQEKPR